MEASSKKRIDDLLASPKQKFFLNAEFKVTRAELKPPRSPEKSCDCNKTEKDTPAK